MNSVDYKQKYLKYKNKYLELKALEESKLNLQTGGVIYKPGDYVFFIPEDQASYISVYSENSYLNKDGTFKNGFDKFTNYLGNCAKFLRVGKPSVTGKDFANTYNTVYTNQSSASVFQRNISSIIKSDDLKTTEKSDETLNSLIEGENCDTTPIKLEEELLIRSEEEYNSNKLIKIVKLINVKQSFNKIKKIIYVKKPIYVYNPTIIDDSKTLNLGYNGIEPYIYETGTIGIIKKIP